MIARAKPPTKAEEQRLKDVAAIPCLPSMIDGWPAIPAEVHHVVEGNKRLGDLFTFPMSPWHHRGITSGSNEATRAQYGPSFALEPRAFVVRYGTERQLVQITDALIRMQRRRLRDGSFIGYGELLKLARELHTEIVR